MSYDSKNMNLHENNGVIYLTFPMFDKYKFINHAFSTKIGGVSKNEFASMNLNYNRGDSNQNVTENFHRFCLAAGFDFSTLTASSQDHHTFIRRVSTENIGVGIFKPKDIKSVDGLVTNEKDITLVTYYADCVPLFFLDTEKRAIGLSHAGWRGTVQEIGTKTIKTMIKEFGSRPSDIIVGIGPSIGPCCFEVDTPVYNEFVKLKQIKPNEFITKKHGGKYMIDLWEANRRIIINAGVPENNITVSKLCTKCNSDWLYSHRAQGPERGGLAAMMCLTEDNI